MRQTPLHFFVKAGLLLCLPALFISFDSLLLSPDYFAFRTWEGLATSGRFRLFPGPFYANQRVERIEEGDLGPHTPAAVKKTTTWVTDRFGYRNDAVTSCSWFSVVVVGDSNVVGTGLTQSDTFGERLKRRIDPCIYSFAPESLESFLYRFPMIAKFPKIVVWALIERDIWDLKPEVKTELPMTELNQLLWKISLLPLFRDTMILADRAVKSNLMRYIKTKTLPWFNPPPGFVEKKRTSPNEILFFQGKFANRPFQQAQIATIADHFSHWERVFRRHEIHLILLPIPNKETVIIDKLPNGPNNGFLAAVIAELKHRKLAVVDVLTPFQKVYGGGALPFHTDDTHWNSVGSELAAKETAKIIQSYSKTAL